MNNTQVNCKAHAPYLFDGDCMGLGTEGRRWKAALVGDVVKDKPKLTGLRLVAYAQLLREPGTVRAPDVLGGVEEDGRQDEAPKLLAALRKLAPEVRHPPSALLLPVKIATYNVRSMCAEPKPLEDVLFSTLGR